MIIYNKININKIKEPEMLGSIHKDTNPDKKDQQNKNTNKSKHQQKNIYHNLKIKASIINTDQRTIQDKITQIQIQEQKISQMEETLNAAKQEYTETLQNEKKQENKQKIRIKQLSKEINTLQNEADNESPKHQYIEDITQATSLISNTLTKINQIKNKLYKYKSQLISLEQAIQDNKNKISSEQKNIQKELIQMENSKEEMLYNPLDFIFLQGDISTGLIINIYV